MADIEFRRALRAWYEEQSFESGERAVKLGLRQGMGLWEIFETLLSDEDAPFHRIVAETDDEGIRAVLALLADQLVVLEMNAFSQGTWSTGQDAIGDPQYIEGTEYRPGFVDRDNRGIPYVLEDGTGEIWIRDTTNYTAHRVSNPEVRDSILNLRAQDMLILASRYFLAKSAAGDDDALYRIFSEHINFTGGAIEEPTVVDDIPFWQIGRNASHSFYYGYLDGQLYRMSEGYDYDVVTDQEYLDQTVTPISNFGGYMGHY